ncbi:DUF1385 domain-containing protein [Sporolactobacillus sp. Y61]|uniref:DUF1385 domain-containing protein n=1 Tax=Sporolactobacillus sp. Y61 TaxID=3160863 RepID=A0AAU8IEA4_9BACL
MSEHVPVYGGQAVIEGVMMGGKYTTVTAVRRKDHSVSYYECPKEDNPSLNTLKKIPIIRGIVAILEASGIGTKHLNFASEVYDADPAEDGIRAVQKDEKKKRSLSTILGLTAIGILTFLFSKFVFTLVPAVVASFFEPLISSNTGQVLLEGLFKIILLIGYIYLVYSQNFSKTLRCLI